MKSLRLLLVLVLSSLSLFAATLRVRRTSHRAGCGGRKRRRGHHCRFAWTIRYSYESLLSSQWIAIHLRTRPARWHGFGWIGPGLDSTGLFGSAK